MYLNATPYWFVIVMLIIIQTSVAQHSSSSKQGNSDSRRVPPQPPQPPAAGAQPQRQTAVKPLTPSQPSRGPSAPQQPVGSPRPSVNQQPARQPPAPQPQDAKVPLQQPQRVGQNPDPKVISQEVHKIFQESVRAHPHTNQNAPTKLPALLSKIQGQIISPTPAARKSSPTTKRVHPTTRTTTKKVPPRTTTKQGHPTTATKKVTPRATTTKKVPTSPSPRSELVQKSTTISKLRVAFPTIASSRTPAPSQPKRGSVSKNLFLPYNPEEDNPPKPIHQPVEAPSPVQAPVQSPFQSDKGQQTASSLPIFSEPLHQQQPAPVSQELIQQQHHQPQSPQEPYVANPRPEFPEYNFQSQEEAQVKNPNLDERGWPPEQKLHEHNNYNQVNERSSGFEPVMDPQPNLDLRATNEQAAINEVENGYIQEQAYLSPHNYNPQNPAYDYNNFHDAHNIPENEQFPHLPLYEFRKENLAEPSWAINSNLHDRFMHVKPSGLENEREPKDEYESYNRSSSLSLSQMLVVFNLLINFSVHSVLVIVTTYIVQ